MRVRRKKLESKGWRWEREWANKNERGSEKREEEKDDEGRGGR